MRGTNSTQATKMRRRTASFFKRRKSTIITFIIVTFFFLFLSGENILQEFTPRRLCMYNKVDLIALHVFSDSVITIACVAASYLLYRIYKVFKGLQLPWKGFIWMFAGFIFMFGLTHFISVLNIWVTFYWIDGLFKLFTAVFLSGVALTLHSDFRSIMEMNLDFKMMAEKLSNVIHEAEEKYEKIIHEQEKQKNDINRSIRGDSE